MTIHTCVLRKHRWGDGWQSETPTATFPVLTPVYSREQIDKAQMHPVVKTGASIVHSVLRDAASIGAYAFTYNAVRLVAPGLPAPVKIVAAAAAAGATSDVLKDGDLEGPLGDPGAWTRGAGAGLASHYLWNMTVGRWSNTALQNSANLRVYETGALSQPYNAPGVSKLSAYLNPRNMLGSPAVTGDTLAASEGAQLLSMQQHIHAASTYRLWQGRIGFWGTIGALPFVEKKIDDSLQK